MLCFLQSFPMGYLFNNLPEPASDISLAGVSISEVFFLFCVVLGVCGFLFFRIYKK